ncbi:hypothetical protein SAMN05443665_1014129 [Actinomadura meyerae]|uniref:WD40-like Beta Propeller Repeat n=1 Tax=Actinomadura meyerae TaxID=240840 RepID=A0A239JDX7_9ACTN|nr:hypothetical protein SAMN05443665_1014129 [Actinomadura meyerae]
MAAPKPTPTPSPAVTSTAPAKARFRPTDPRLARPAAMVAGMAHPDIWWTVATAGGRSMLFALDTKGRTRAAYTLAGASPGARLDAVTVVKNSAGEAGLFVTELNAGQSGAFTLHRIAEPAQLSGGTLPVKSFKVAYPDGGHAANTLLADPDESRLYVITTGEDSAAVFALPSVLGPGKNALTKLRSLPFPVRGGQFARDGRVVLKSTADVRVLGGIREDAGQVVRTAASMAGKAFGVTSDGKQVLLAGGGLRPVFRSVVLPEPNAATRARPTISLPATERAAPVTIPDKSGLPGGVLGTGALAGLVLLGVLAGGFYLRGRRQG